MDIDKPLKQYLNPDNFEDRLQGTQDALGANTSARVGSASEIAAMTGTQIVGNLISPAPSVTDLEVTSTDFTGTFMSGEGATFNSVTYNIGGVNAGVLQWGARQSDGTVIANSGNITLNTNGISVLSGATTVINLNSNGMSILSATDTASFFPEKSIRFVDANGNNVFRLGSWVDVTNEINSLTLDGITSSDTPTHAIDISLLAQTDFGSAATLDLLSSTSGASSATITADTVNINNLASVTTARMALSAGFLNLGANNTLTIASDTITATKSYHLVDTEAAAATDNLSTINGGSTGDILVLRSANSARDVTLKDGTGNLALAGDFTLDNVQDTITLMSTGTTWLELCRSNNA